MYEWEILVNCLKHGQLFQWWLTVLMVVNCLKRGQLFLMVVNCFNSG